MSAPRVTAALGAALLLAAAPAAPAGAQERPAEADLFGGPAVQAPAAPVVAPSTPAREPVVPPGQRADGDARGDAILGEPSGPRATGLISAEREDWLRLGGLSYLRAATSWGRGQPPASWTFTDPALLDVYLDARPNDRVRAYALGRMIYTPSNATTAAGFLAATTVGPVTLTALDQMWITFDLGRTVFVTAGRQHVKWGTGRFWNPTDYLHPTPLDPLSQYDLRTGVTMVKAHLPWEKRGWNFYGVALLDDLAGGARPDGTVQAASTLGRVGGGARAEVVLGSLEVGLDALAQRGHAPRLGVDGSFPLGDLDLRFDLALRRGRDAPRWEEADPAALNPLDRFKVRTFSGLTPAAVVGAEWSWKYSDQDTLTVGGEYAYDASGYASARIYPYLLALPLLPGTPDRRTAFTPLHLARQYAGLYLYLPAPGSWNDTTITLSALGSVTDGSALIRLDHAVVINTYLRLETFVAGHAGHQFGEFRFGGTVRQGQGGAGLPPVDVAIPVPVLDLGVALRVAL